ncbi:MAG: carboxypeptidase regulatory-like domain-containing protein [Acidobacteria bacterium]|nr:carboxypeptidase regulatory-like domain-containing protein [Acidobacteriota bacterium]
MSLVKAAGCLLLAATIAISQNIYTTLNGTAIDPSGAAIVNAKGTLTDQAKGTTRTFATGTDGSFVVPNVPPGKYDVNIQASGFKTLIIRDVVLTAGEVRSLGRLTLELGGIVESIQVEAQATPVQVSSSERSGLVTGQQVNDIAVKGRDFASYLITIPGVVDTASGGREAMARNALGSIHINGGRGTSLLMTVDGMPSMDSGNNGVPDEPNMDAIAEVKIMTTNYQAEYGRNAGGLVSVVTKSGSKDFHGSAYDFYRHESLNANNFFNNRTGTKKAPYRYRITGYSIGGPVLLPKLNFNRNKDKLFFFFSQELVGSRNNWAPQFINVPTELERNGDYSRSFDISGKLIPVKDPSTGQPFPGNVIPKDRINKLGQSMLNFLPLPNYTDPDPANLYRRNYRTIPSGGWPRRQEVVRVDYNITPSFQGVLSSVGGLQPASAADRVGRLAGGRRELPADAGDVGPPRESAGGSRDERALPHPGERGYLHPDFQQRDHLRDQSQRSGPEAHGESPAMVQGRQALVALHSGADLRRHAAQHGEHDGGSTAAGRSPRSRIHVHGEPDEDLAESQHQGRAVHGMEQQVPGRRVADPRRVQFRAGHQQPARQRPRLRQCPAGQLPVLLGSQQSGPGGLHILGRRMVCAG